MSHSSEKLLITSTAEPPQADVDAVLAGLRAYNEHHAGPANFKRVALFLRDESGVVKGGLVGKQAWGWLYVEFLWVSEELRGQRLGTQLMDRAEREARADGCIRVLLDTLEFQARPFYEARGYELFGVLEDFPPGFRRFYMTKKLDGAGAATAGNERFGS
jgi:GNAT superfamily N-acetyltransferase